MSGNAALDRQIAQAMMPQYNPMQAIQQMQRQPLQIQPVQNPIFGGNIPMNFGLPQQAQMPVGYQSPMAMYRPAAFDSYTPAYNKMLSQSQGGFDASMGWNPNGVFSQGHGGGGE